MYPILQQGDAINFVFLASDSHQYSVPSEIIIIIIIGLTAPGGPWPS
jgi:hypothetical protein